MLTDTAIEIVSPLNHLDTDCVCRVAKIPGLVATCAGCGHTVYRNVHLPLIAFGFWCNSCCPCTRFVPTPQEVEAIERHRAYAGKDGDAARESPSHEAKPVKSIERVSPERRAGRKPIKRRKRKIAPCLLAAGLSPFWKG